MVTPKWVSTRIQPIAVRDVLRYLVGCAALPPDVNRAFDIGGPDVLTYRHMMHRYARVAGLRQRVLIPVPVLTPAAVVPLGRPGHPGPGRPGQAAGRVAAATTSSAPTTTSPAYVPDPPGGLLAASTTPSPSPCGTSARPTSPPAGPRPAPRAPRATRCRPTPRLGRRLPLRGRAGRRRARPPRRPVGGDRGHRRRAPAGTRFPAAWAVRGLLDRLAGGVGLRRGRRDPRRLRVGDALDFWRVEEIDPRLAAAAAGRDAAARPGLARADGRGRDAGGTTPYSQRAIFQPRGLAGHAYWWSISPFHGIVFGGMARNITQAAHQATPQPHPPPNRPPTPNRP